MVGNVRQTIPKSRQGRKNAAHPPLVQTVEDRIAAETHTQDRPRLIRVIRVIRGLLPTI